VDIGISLIRRFPGSVTSSLESEGDRANHASNWESFVLGLMRCPPTLWLTLGLTMSVFAALAYVAVVVSSRWKAMFVDLMVFLNFSELRLQSTTKNKREC